MAIRFQYNLNTLVADISAGGFAVREVKTVTNRCGRMIDLHLDNGTIICWDKESQYIWAEGPRNRINEVEKFLRTLYQGPKSTRWIVRRYNRYAVNLSKMSAASGLWLLRSNSASARTIRQLITALPRIPVKQHRSGSLAVN
jgi:hypothetical protein